jgi:hypothetical protein
MKRLVRSISSWLALGIACAATIATPATEALFVSDEAEVRVVLDPNDDGAAEAIARALRVAVNDAVVEASGGFAATATLEVCVASSLEADAPCAPSYSDDGDAITPSGPAVTLSVSSENGQVDSAFARRAEPAFFNVAVLDDGTEEVLHLSFAFADGTETDPLQLLVSARARAEFPGLDTGSIVEAGDPLPEGAEVTIEEVEATGATGEDGVETP